MNVHKVFIALLLLTGCHPRSCLLEPEICYTPNKQYIQTLPSAFEPLSPHELDKTWGEEIKIGTRLAQDLDFYRAITAFKRALILLPNDKIDRRQQVEFSIVQCYWMGKKYCEAIEAFETTSLTSVTSKFPAFRELMLILYESYHRTDQQEKAKGVMSLMEKGDPETADDLKIFTALDEGNLRCSEDEEISQFIRQYCACAKSVRKAQTLNALLPGAGYFYVGQKKTALTSFIINTTFIAAAYHFFERGNWGAGLIASSLEFGWYFGGINGAGLAAKEYNQCIYQEAGKELMVRKQLFPVLMLETSF